MVLLHVGMRVNSFMHTRHDLIQGNQGRALKNCKGLAAESNDFDGINPSITFNCSNRLLKDGVECLVGMLAAPSQANDNMRFYLLHLAPIIKTHMCITIASHSLWFSAPHKFANFNAEEKKNFKVLVYGTFELIYEDKSEGFWRNIINKTESEI